MRAERRDTGLYVGLVGSRQFSLRRRHLARREIEHAKQHAEAAELDDDVLLLAEFGDPGSPLGEGFFLLAGVRSDPERPADMVPDDRRLREDTRQVSSSPAEIRAQRRYSAATGALAGSGFSPRNRGRTSLAKSVMLATVSAWSRKPPWPNIKRLPKPPTESCNALIC
jgi:hypothetical protein